MFKNVHTLFPQTVTVNQINIDNDKLISLIKEDLSLNGNFYLSNSNKLHEDARYDFFTESLMKEIQQIFDEVYCFSHVKPYITLMWATCSEFGQSIHSHTHPNSFLSGVYYPQDIEYPPIRFYDPLPKTIVPDFKSPNIYNLRSYIFHPRQGEIFTFPSYLQHETAVNNLEKSDRISISFNIFVKGLLGVEDPLSRLILK